MKRLSLTLVGAGLAAAATGSALVLATGDDSTPTPAATETSTPAPPTPTATPFPPTPTPTPSPTILKEPRAIPEAILSVDPGISAPGMPVAADPVRVYTGDGDCLNVRPQAGTSFEATPYTCVPEGTLLWLVGEPVAIDNETWRYALGAGWVAIGYTQPTEAPYVDLPGGTVTVWNLGIYREQKQGNGIAGLPGADVHVARVDLATGETTREITFAGYQGGMGGRNPEISPDGRFIAYTANDPNTGQARTIIGDIDAGTATQIPGWPADWNAANQIITTIQYCESLCRNDLAVYDARSGELTPLLEQATGYPIGWNDDASAVLYVTDARLLVEVAPGGTVREIGQLPEDASLWDAEPSPRGDILLSTAGLGSMQLTDANTAAISKFTRAPQRELPGKCGGTWSRSTGWLDETTFFYHERSSSNGKDGITVARTTGEILSVFPFFNAQDLSSPAPGQLAFASWSETGGGSANIVTFVLDIAMGDFVPVVTGSGAVWSD